MQLHVVGTAATATPHYATLPPKFRRGLPDGAAQTDCNSAVSPQDGDASQEVNQQPGTVYYAMNV
jgi:hypothetical protein